MTFKIEDERVIFENGQKCPIVGFGTWPLKERECYEVITKAIAAGYR